MLPVVDRLVAALLGRHEPGASTVARCCDRLWLDMRAMMSLLISVVSMQAEQLHLARAFTRNSTWLYQPRKI